MLDRGVNDIVDRLDQRKKLASPAMAYLEMCTWLQMCILKCVPGSKIRGLNKSMWRAQQPTPTRNKLKCAEGQ